MGKVTMFQVHRKVISNQIHASAREDSWNLKGSGDGVQHSELLAFWALQ
jgi:hypothetical protein